MIFTEEQKRLVNILDKHWPKTLDESAEKLTEEHHELLMAIHERSRSKMIDEIGDNMGLLIQMCRTLGESPRDVLELTINKLESRGYYA